MKYSPWHLASCMLIILASVNMANAQQRLDSDPQKASHNIYSAIEQNYKDGQLNIDQKVLYKFYATGNREKLSESYQLKTSEPIKCGTPAITDFYKNRQKLSGSTISEIKSMMKPPTIQSSETYQSASGNFEIHYETSGSHAVPQADENENGIPDYVEEVASAADSSYRHQVQTLGYTDPISDSQPYEILIRNLQSFYGDTWPERGTTYIRIENDFAEEGFASNDHPENDQTGAIYATVAHEFKHAIQYAATQWKGETGNWLEMDATLMEEVVYDDVNDYYHYLNWDTSIFKNPEGGFYPGSYEHVTWALFFEEKFGSQFWVNVWETIKANPQITMVDALTQQLSGEEAYQKAFTESQLWHFASGDNSSADFGFEESTNYPSPDITYQSVGDNPLTMPDTLNHLSASYFDIQPSPFPGAIAVNLTKNNNSQAVIAALGYFNDGTVEPVIIDNNKQESSKYETSWRWDEINKLGIVAANGSDQQEIPYGLALESVNPQTVRIEQNYPNPFSDETTIRFSLTNRQNVQLEIFDVLGRKIVTLIEGSLSEGIYTEQFNGRDYASGIYFFRLTIGGDITTKQMTLVK